MQKRQVRDIVTRTETQTDLQTLISSSSSSYLHLIILHYLSWPPWRNHVAKLEKELTLLSEAGCKVALVSFGTTQVGKINMICTVFHFLVVWDWIWTGHVCWQGQVPLQDVGPGPLYISGVHDTIKYVAVMNIHGRDLPSLIDDDNKNSLFRYFSHFLVMESSQSWHQSW